MEPEPHEVHALNKPAGVVSTARDTHGRTTVVQLVRSRRRLYPVGRLDADTTGLILLTNDGELAERLTHPRYGVKKVYRARVQPAPALTEGLEALKKGVELEEGRTAPARCASRRAGWSRSRSARARSARCAGCSRPSGHRVVELERVAFGPLACAGWSRGRAGG